MSGVRQQIVDQIQTGLAAIAQGETVQVDSRDAVITYTYQTSFAIVREHNTSPWSEEQLPAISFGDASAELEYPQGFRGYAWHNVDFFVRVFVGETEQGAAALRAAMQDVIAFFAAQKRIIDGGRFNGLAHDLRMTANRIDLDEGGQWLGSGTLFFRLRYYEADSTL